MAGFDELDRNIKKNLEKKNKGRPKKTESEKQNCKISLNFTKKERDALQKNITEQYGLPVAVYIKMLLRNEKLF